MGENFSDRYAMPPLLPGQLPVKIIYWHNGTKVINETYPDGIVLEWGRSCESWLLLPAENLWPLWLRALLYFMAMAYMFVGVAIASDLFMCAIEVITSKKKKITIYDEQKQEYVDREVLVWNETVANLTLMALGSSAPEILLAIIETIMKLGKPPNPAEDGLGVFTIVGSASYNLLVISAICVMSVPSGEAKRIREFGVFMWTSVWSIFAYLWMFLVVEYLSPGIINIIEAFVTLLFFPLLVVTAYAQDCGWWLYKCKRKGARVTDERAYSLESVRVVGVGNRRGSFMHSQPPPELSALERQCRQNLQKRETINGTHRSNPLLKQRRVSLGQEDEAGHPLQQPQQQPQQQQLSNHQPLPHHRNREALQQQLTSDSLHNYSNSTQSQEMQTAFARARFRHVAVRGLVGRRRVINKETGAPTVTATATSKARLPRRKSMADVVVLSNSRMKKTLGDQMGKFSFASPSYSVVESAGIIEIDVLFHRRAKKGIGYNSRPSSARSGFAGEVASPAHSYPPPSPSGRLSPSHYAPPSVMSALPAPTLLPMSSPASPTMNGFLPTGSGAVAAAAAAAATAAASAATDTTYLSAVEEPPPIYRRPEPEFEGDGLFSTPASAAPTRSCSAAGSHPDAEDDAVGDSRSLVASAPYDDDADDDDGFGVVTVEFETKEGTAKEDKHYKHMEGTLVFQETDFRKTIGVPIMDDFQYEPDREFYIILKNAKGETGIGDPGITRVTIIDDDEPGEFQFEEPRYIADPSSGQLVATVIRQKGCDGAVSVEYSTLNGSATGGEAFEEGVDFISLQGTLEFKHGESSKTIAIEINPDCTGLKNFVITLRNPSIGSKIGTNNAAIADICSDPLLPRLASVISDQEEPIGYRDQIRLAMSLQTDVDEDGNEIPLTHFDFVIHFVTFFWKVFLALIPPPRLGGGWPAFVVSLLVIGGMTAIIEQLGGLLGCVINLNTQVTGITIVALGTSLPDTFASRTAAMQDSTADASIGNVTGSNSVNVFLGLGLPWVLGVLYAYASTGKTYFELRPKGMQENVTLFVGLGTSCIIILILRRFIPQIGGELGGPRVVKYLTGAILFSLWLIYILVSSFRSYGYF